jgi:hypothetical protein
VMAATVAKTLNNARHTGFCPVRADDHGTPLTPAPQHGIRTHALEQHAAAATGYEPTEREAHGPARDVNASRPLHAMISSRETPSHWHRSRAMASSRVVVAQCIPGAVTRGYSGRDATYGA